jgi:hypothetical protein
LRSSEGYSFDSLKTVSVELDEAVFDSLVVWSISYCVIWNSGDMVISASTGVDSAKFIISSGFGDNLQVRSTLPSSILPNPGHNLLAGYTPGEVYHIDESFHLFLFISGLNENMGFLHRFLVT